MTPSLAPHSHSPSPVELAQTPGGTVYRKLFHLLAGSILPVIGCFVPTPVILGLASGAAGISVAGESIRLRYEPFNRWLATTLRPLLKAKEWRRPTASTYMLLAAVVVFAAFPKPVAVLALLFLSVGDPLASLVGERFGRTRVLRKSLEGSLTFLVAAMAMGALFALTQSEPKAATVFAGAAVATVAELVGGPVDDNFLVPVVSGAVMAGLEWSL